MELIILFVLTVVCIAVFGGVWGPWIAGLTPFVILVAIQIPDWRRKYKAWRLERNKPVIFSDAAHIRASKEKMAAGGNDWRDV